MKTPRYRKYLIFTIAILSIACLAQPGQAAEYTGSSVIWPNQGTFTGTAFVTESGLVTDVSLYIANAHTYQGFNFNTIILTAPDNITQIELFNMVSSPISGKSLYMTRFIDTASINITDGNPPYAGSFSPAENFSTFDGHWMTGT